MPIGRVLWFCLERGQFAEVSVQLSQVGLVFEGPSGGRMLGQTCSSTGQISVTVQYASVAACGPELVAWRRAMRLSVFSACVA